MNTKEKINGLLKFDSLSHAEKITGLSYKENESVVGSGMLLQMDKSEKLNALLNAEDDTLFSNTVDDYVRKIESFGFKQVYYEDFIYIPDYGDNKPQNERMQVFYQYQLGILLCFDTFGYTNVNSGHFYYNWSPYGYMDRNGCTSSGSYYFDKLNDHITLFTEDFKEIVTLDMPEKPKYDYDKESWTEFRERSESIEVERLKIIEDSIDNGSRVLWIGDHDCREAVKTNITLMMNYGTFCPEWKQCAFPWLCNYSDFKKGYELSDYYELTKERLKKFPIDVLNKIGQYRD